MKIDMIGWDIGGAHLKAAALEGDQVVSVHQRPCALWLGLDRFHEAAASLLKELSPAPGCRHAVTMTGELADLFANREEGVFGLLRALSEHVQASSIMVFAGRAGFLAADAVRHEHAVAVASANWLATGYYAKDRTPSALLVDVGSTTSDLTILRNGLVWTRGYTDGERLRYDELIYSGVTRTPLMAFARRAPFEGEWLGLMAEHFATAADVYRLTGELPDYADQSPPADGGEKSSMASARRIARLLGRDLESADMEAWIRLAGYFRERQLGQLMDAARRHLSRGLLKQDAPLIGAGVGRFLARDLAARLGQPYLDFIELLPKHSLAPGFLLADCAPAVAVAFLARQDHE
jgi:probable H4MPT-linked C1 transfer pathway protein